MSLVMCWESVFGRIFFSGMQRFRTADQVDGIVSRCLSNWWREFNMGHSSNLKTVLMNSWSLSWRKNHSRNGVFFLWLRWLKSKLKKFQRRLISLAVLTAWECKMEASPIRMHFCEVREASNLRLQVLIESMRGEAWKGWKLVGKWLLSLAFQSINKYYQILEDVL